MEKKLINVDNPTDFNRFLMTAAFCEQQSDIKYRGFDVVSPAADEMCCSYEGNGRHIIDHPVNPPCGHRICKICLHELTTSCSNSATSPNSMDKVECPVRDCNISNTEKQRGYLRLDELDTAADDLNPDIAQQIGNLQIKCSDEGCLWRGRVRNINDHNIDGPHLSLSIANEIDNQLSMAGSITRSNRRATVLEAKTKEQDEKIASLEETIKGQSRAIKALWYLLGSSNNKVQDLQDLRDKYDEQYKQEVTVEDLIPGNYNSEHTWKIFDYGANWSAAVKDDKKRIESEPFFVKPGYKIMLFAYLNGHGNGFKTHCSLYLHMLRGENDDNLKWPFDKLIGITIVNQKNNSKNIEEHINSRADICREVFIKPKFERNKTFVGFHKLVTLDRLKSDDGFIKNDVLLIKIKVFN